MIKFILLSEISIAPNLLLHKQPVFNLTVWIAAVGNFGLLDRVRAHFADLRGIVGAGLAILVIVANC